MSSNSQFSLWYVLGLIAAFAVSLALTKYFLSALPFGDEEPLAWWIGLLYFEAVGTVYIWGLFICDIFGLTGAVNRFRNLGAALITLGLLGTIYSLFLPA